MIISGNDISEYKELLKLSVEDFLIRFKLFIEDLENG